MLAIFKFLLTSLFLVPVLGAPSSAFAPLHELAADAEPVPGSYVVVLKQDTDVDHFITSLTNTVAGNIKHTYKHALKGFSGSFSNAELNIIRQLPGVAYVAPNQIFHVDDQQNGAPYNLAITSESGKLSAQQQDTFYYKPCVGSNCRVVTTYVIDTGIYADHPDFGGRAYQAVNFVDGEANADLNGHGTHVAGTVISNSYGVFKRGFAAGVKVCDASGSCPTESILRGIEWVTNYARGYPSVINMSLSGPASQPIDDMVQGAYNSGITVVVAAGNKPPSDGACNRSPARSAAAIAVGAIDSSYDVAYFSAEDSCVRMHAPGVDVISTLSDGSFGPMSGTSMASPHVAGIIAYFIDQFTSTAPGFLLGQLNKFAERDVITGDLNGGLNLLANNGYYKY